MPADPTSTGEGARIAKHSVTIAGHRTSVSLEAAFWRELQRIAAAEGLSVNALVSRVDHQRAAEGGNLSARLRVLVLQRVLAEPPRGS